MAALSIDIRRKGFPAVGAAAAKPVLGAIKLEVEAGEVLAITSPSGCGKTTLLNLVARLDREFAGTIATSGGRLGYVFQEPRLLPWRTVRQNVALVLRETADADRRALAALAEVGLGEAADVYASRLSLGMARRVALARAFVVEPALLLLDEPFVSLDETNARRLRLLLLDLLARHETTALFVTHQLDEAVMLADRVLVLDGAPARVVALERVGLSVEERRQPDAVAAARRRLATSLGSLAALATDTDRLAEALP